MNQFKDWKSNLDRFLGNEFWGDFEGMIKPTIPSINMYQYDNELVCFVNLPGMSHPKNVDVLVDHSTLTIKGNITITNRGGRRIKSEIHDGPFERQLTLPFPVRSDKIEATYKHGLLVIHLHRYISDSSTQKPVQIRHLDGD